jgi:hypothetical protein
MKTRHTLLLGSGDEPGDRPAAILPQVQILPAVK